MIKCLFLLSFFFVIWTVQCHEVEEDDDGGLWIYEEDFLDQPRRTKVNGRQNFDGNHLNKTTNRPIFGNPNATSMADSAASTELVIEDDTTTSSFASFNVSDHIEVNETIHAGLWGQYIKLYPYLIIPALLVAAAVFHSTVGILINHFMPESCSLILIGMLAGYINQYRTQSNPGLEFVLTMNKDRFFFLLLPPIILQSANELVDRDFFRNIGPIMLFAVFGTCMNIALTSVGLYVVGHNLGAFSLTLSNSINAIEMTMFSTIISAVDPVAVLAIFTELQINNPLYFIVFGEALFNDAVVVTIFTVIEDILESSPTISLEMTFALGLWKFVKVFVGGLVFGAVVGAVTSLLTRITINSRTMEPMLVLAAAYLSYIIAELFHTSSIVSLTICGLMMTSYIKYNLSEETNITLESMIKVGAAVAEILIFFLMGFDSMKSEYHFDSGFILWAIVLCSVGRFLSVFLLTLVSNVWFRKNEPISWVDQIVVSFAGLRGAIAWSLVNMLDSKKVASLPMFKTTTLFIILFTVFVFGISSTPLIRMLRVKRQDPEDKTVFGQINKRVAQSVLPLIEAFAGFDSSTLSARLEYWNDHYIRRWLISGGMKAVVEHQTDKQESSEDSSIIAICSGLHKEFNNADYRAFNFSAIKPESFDIEIVSITRQRIQLNNRIVKAFHEAETEGPFSVGTKVFRAQSLFFPENFSNTYPGQRPTFTRPSIPFRPRVSSYPQGYGLRVEARKSQWPLKKHL